MFISVDKLDYLSTISCHFQWQYSYTNFFFFFEAFIILEQFEVYNKIEMEI